MQTKIRLMTLSALSVALVACGGGGSSGGASPELRSSTPLINNSANPINSSTSTDKVGRTAPISFITGGSGTQVATPEARFASEIQTVIAETNKLRAEKGLAPLVYDERLSAHAQIRAIESASSFSHTRPDGTNWDVGMIGNGGGAENLAAGRALGQQAVTQWKNSTGHYNNIMNAKYTNIGVGVVYVPNGEYKYYWVQIFGEDNVTSQYQFNDITANVGVGKTNTAPLTHLVVGSTTIPLTTTNPNGNWKTFSGGNYNGVVNGYDNSRFGAIKVGTQNPQLFYQGNQTANASMPTTGTATYNGKAVVVNGTQVDTSANAKFNVDFAKKNLTGAITPANKSAINVSANIAGNTFASATGATVKTQGAFFGGQAQELAGVFEDTKSGTTGAFGAKK